MIFDWKREIFAEEEQDIFFNDEIIFERLGLWVCLLSSGQCHLQDNQNHVANAGTIIMGNAPFTLVANQETHILSVRLTGLSAENFIAGLPEAVLFAKGESCPNAAELLQRLCAQLPSQTPSQSILAFSLLCELSTADTTSKPLPPLIAQAVQEMQKNYAQLYGVEELSESLGVSKSHFVRSFSATMGISPGKYLTNIRIDAVKRLLMRREYNLEVIASLCGFSGANYLCRVFKQETGQSPTAWRALAIAQTAPRLATETPLEETLYM